MKVEEATKANSVEAARPFLKTREAADNMECACDSTDGCAANNIRDDTSVFEGPKHANMRPPARGAAPQSYSDFAVSRQFVHRHPTFLRSSKNAAQAVRLSSF